ncbi:MAG: efflux RND transporter periplasmic adaptor subunit [Planctomycetota bacterium]|nr:efflux RND transporter periplasmic adaptor subunit [Planctomycetota bacterium]
MDRGLRSCVSRSAAVLAALLALAGAAGCDRGQLTPVSARDAAGGGGPALPAVPVAVEPAIVGSIASHYRTTATVEVEKEAEVLARVAGIVQAIPAEEGDFVDRDGVLLTIDNEEYRLALTKAEAAARNFKAKYERLTEIELEDLISVEEVETARNDLAVAKAEEGLARVNLSYATVRSPFAGRVVRRLVDEGQNVSVGTALFRVADFDPLLARVHVPAKEFGKLRREQKVKLVLDSSRERLEGSIKLVSPIIDPSTGTIKITVEISHYPRGTRPGDFAEVLVVTEERTGATLVDKEAVITDKGERVVFVALEGRVAERRPVEVGFVDDEHAEILDGVDPGELVVVKGQRSLKNGSPVKIREKVLEDREAPRGPTGMGS